MNRQQYFFTITDLGISGGDLAYVQNAYWLVKEAHRRQFRRLTGERYFEHVRRVSFMAGVTYGYADVHHFALGLLHDVVEDTFVPRAVIVNMFGQGMYHDILALSKEIPTFDPTNGNVLNRVKLTDDAYYGALAVAGIVPRRIKGCDRLDNIADLTQWEATRQQKYIIETNTLVLPIIDQTDNRMAAEIRRRLIV